MSKKVVQEVPVKKKKHGCRNCFFTLLIFIVLLGVAGYFVGDYFTQKYVNLSLMDCFKIASDLRSNGSSSVTNKFSSADKTALDRELKNQLFLNENADFSTDDFFNALMDSLNGGDKNVALSAGKENTALSETVHLLNTDGGTETDGGIMDMLTKLYVRENLDLARLQAYSADKHDTDYVLKLTDRSLAAALDSVLPQLIDNIGNKGLLADYGIEKLSEIVELEQIIFEKQTVRGAEVPVLKLTVALNARKVAGVAIQKYAGMDLSFIATMILPKRIYATAQVALKEGVTLPQPVYINKMNDAKMDRVYKLIQGITKAAGSEADVKAMINEQIGNIMTPILQQTADILPFDTIADHTLTVDVFGTVLKISKINEGKEDPITAPELIGTLAGIVASDAEKAIDGKHAFSDQYKNADGTVTYDPARTDKTNLIDYENEFMQEIADKYLLNLSGLDPIDAADDITFADLLNLFGITATENPDGGKQIELLDLFDVKRLSNVLSLPVTDLTVNLNDRMVGAILNAQISALMDVDSALATLSPQLKFVILSQEDGHNFIEAGIQISIDKLLGENESALSGVLNNLLGTKAVLKVKVDVTPSADPAFAYKPSELMFNDRTVAQTDAILSTVNKLTGGFDVSSLLSSVDAPMRSAIASMSKVLPIRLLDSRPVQDSADLPTAIALPGIFDAIDAMLFQDDVQNKIDGEGIRAVLKGIDAVNDAEYLNGILSANPPAENYNGFMAQMKQKYYLNADGADFNDLFVGNGKLIDSGSVNNPSTPLKPNLANFNIAALIADADAGNLYAAQSPVFFDNELGKMLSDQIQTDAMFSKGFKVAEFSITAEGKLKLVLELDVASFIGDANGDKLRLLPASKVYVTALVDPTEIVASGGNAYYKTALQVNNMTDETFAVFEAMLSTLNGGAAAFDFEKTREDLGAMIYKQFDALANSLGVASLTFAPAQDAEGNMRMGIALPSYFDFLHTSVSAFAGMTDTDLISALKQL